MGGRGEDHVHVAAAASGPCFGIGLGSWVGVDGEHAKCINKQLHNQTHVYNYISLYRYVLICICIYRYWEVTFLRLQVFDAPSFDCLVSACGSLIPRCGDRSAQNVT